MKSKLTSDTQQPNLLKGFLACLAILIIAGGCQNKDSESSKKESNDSALPKQDIHKPENYSLAVNRLSEIFDAILADTPLPAPIEYQVLEVIHGTGAGAHSHYYPVGKEDHDHDHDHDDHEHEDMESQEKIHDVSVDIFTELSDIVRWLPNIAGESDMKQDDWNTVNDIAKSMGSDIESAAGGKSDEKAREALREMQTELQVQLKQLQSLVKADTSAGNE